MYVPVCWTFLSVLPPCLRISSSGTVRREPAFWCSSSTFSTYFLPVYYLGDMPSGSVFPITNSNFRTEHIHEHEYKHEFYVWIWNLRVRTWKKHNFMSGQCYWPTYSIRRHLDWMYELKQVEVVVTLFDRLDGKVSFFMTYTSSY